MSGATDAVVLPVGLIVGVPLVVAGVALAGVGAAAFAVANQMHQDYLAALEEFDSRTEAEERRRTDSNRQQVASAAAAMSALARARYTDGEEATALFLRENITRLLQRVQTTQNPDLIAACQALQAEAMQPAADPSPLLDRLFSLSEKVTASAGRAGASFVKSKQATHDILQQALDAARAEIDSLLLSGPECRALRTQLQARWEALQPLAEREPALLMQGLALLRERIHREVKQQAEQVRQREERTAAWRASINDMLAKLYAVSRLTDSPSYVRQAETLLKELSEALARSQRAEEPAITALKVRTDTLFTECQKWLQDQALVQYIGAEVTDVLLSMGYRVLPVESEEAGQSAACMANFEGSIGVQFRAEADGRLRTEMVAFTDQAAQIDPATQERVCCLIDEVFQALKKRDFKVREKSRRTLAKDHRLRIVPAPDAQKPAEAPRTAVPQVHKRVQP